MTGTALQSWTADRHEPSQEGLRCETGVASDAEAPPRQLGPLHHRVHVVLHLLPVIVLLTM